MYVQHVLTEKEYQSRARLLFLLLYSKTCPKRPFQMKTKFGLIFKTVYRLMQVKSIAECMLQYFRPSFIMHLQNSLANICL